MTATRDIDIPLQAGDGHDYTLLARIPPRPTAALLWLPALGVAARHYLPFAEGLAARGVAVFVHEWRGNGSSSLRASRERDWNYRTLLTVDLPVSEAAIREALPATRHVIGGHSLGGQLACCRLGLAPDAAQALWLVASGSPYWRAFPASKQIWLPLAYRLLPWLANRFGSLPGHRIGFGGAEARGLIDDWSRSAMSGRYAASGMAFDFEAALAELTPAVRAVVLADDWLAPGSSLRFLLSKMPHARAGITELEAAALGTRADHFAWMKRPDSVIEALVDQPNDTSGRAGSSGAAAGTAGSAVRGDRTRRGGDAR